MKCRKVKAVILFHTPSKTKEPEKFYHHLLNAKIQDPVVNTNVMAKGRIFEPNAEAVNIVLQMLSENTLTVNHLSCQIINDHENDDLTPDQQLT